jgi:hypothetical protein
MPSHQQVWVKVNAPVDQGVAGIVSALSQFEGLETVESCQGDANRGAWVCFRYGRYWDCEWTELADFFLGYLAPKLVQLVGDDVNLRIQIAPSGQIFGELSTRPGAEHRVETALRKLADSVNVFQPRKTGCSCGMFGTERERC